MNNPDNFSKAQHALEMHQNLITQCTSVVQPVMLTKKNLVHLEEDEVESNKEEEVVGNISTATHNSCNTTNTDNEQSSNDHSPTYHMSTPPPHPTTPIVPLKQSQPLSGMRAKERQLR
jgi:hypothetical protein